MKGFLEELTWRNMIHDTTPGVEAHLKEGPRVGYIGFDPTAPSMTIGNYVQIMLLTLFQRAGHTPIVLMGGATGRIGDPSGKDKERQLKSYEELDRNLNAQVEQMKKFLRFDGPNAARLVNNYDFYKDMNVLDFLRDVGKNLTVNYMLSKDSVKKRLDTGLSFTEFSYQLLQAYDYLKLFEEENCTIQMGGSDQWGNITSGTEFIRRNTTKGKAYAITTPLLTKADGTKFGKSEEGNIWLDAKLTSPYKFYQFWINADDADIPTYTRYFTLKSKEEVEAMEAAGDLRAMKAELAKEITSRIHGNEAYNNVLKVSELLFERNIKNDNIKDLSNEVWHMVANEIPTYTLSKSIFNDKIDNFFIINTNIFKSKGELRRSIKGNALSINKQKITTPDITINMDDLLPGGFILVENGKKNKFLLKIKNE